MSTRSMKPLLEKMNKYKFDGGENMNFDDTVTLETEQPTSSQVKLINKFKNDDLSNIIEEDGQTQFGWAKLIHKKEEEIVNRTYTSTTHQTPPSNLDENNDQKSSQLTKIGSVTKTTSLISWDYYNMGIDEKKSDITSDFTSEIFVDGINETHKIQQQQQQYNETFTATKQIEMLDPAPYNVNMQPDYYQIAACISNLSPSQTTINAEVSTYKMRQHQSINAGAGDSTQLVINKSKVETQNTTFSVTTNTAALPKLAEPPDFSILKDTEPMKSRLDFTTTKLDEPPSFSIMKR